MFSIDIRSRKTNNIVDTILETESYSIAFLVKDEYDKEYGKGLDILRKYPKEEYFIGIYNDWLRKY